MLRTLGIMFAMKRKATILIFCLINFLRVGDGRHSGGVLRLQREDGRAASFGHAPAGRVVHHQELGHSGVVRSRPRATQTLELRRGLQDWVGVCVLAIGWVVMGR